MQDAKLPPTEAISSLHHMACQMVDLARQGRWEQVAQLIDDRRALIDRIDSPPASIEGNLAVLCRQIMTFDEETLRLIKQAMHEILQETNRLQKQSQTVRAYRLSRNRPSQPPQHLDEKK